MGTPGSSTMTPALAMLRKDAASAGPAEAASDIGVWRKLLGG